MAVIERIQMRQRGGESQIMGDLERGDERRLSKRKRHEKKVREKVRKMREKSKE